MITALVLINVTRGKVNEVAQRLLQLDGWPLRRGSAVTYVHQ